MKYFAAFLVWGFLFAFTPAAQGQEPPHLDFVRGLRAKQMAELALEYLQELGKKKVADEVAILLPLELAQTRLELAGLEEDEGRRSALQAQAKSEFETFLKRSAKHPRAAEANLALARLTAMQGKAQLGRARRHEAKEIQRAESLKARTRFEEAGQQLKAAAGQIDRQLAALSDANTPEALANKQALTQAKFQAEFELGLNFFDQAQTYTEQAELLKRGQIIKSASDILSKIAGQDSKNTLCWLARTWQGRCFQENDDPKSARKLYQDVINENGEHADVARRLARYFRMQTLAKDLDVKKPLATLQQIEDAGERWLSDYRKYRNTAEGQGVRFELASTLLKHGLLLPGTQQVQMRDLLSRAQKLFQELEQTENDYTELARENKLNIILKISSERTRGDIAKLKDFEECYLRAQFDIGQLTKAEKELTGEKLLTSRKEHLNNAVNALNRALQLADPKVPAQELSDARYLLARTYFATEDYYRAAVLGEDLARTAPRMNRAPAAGGYALYAYMQLLAEDEQRGAAAEVLEADRYRLRALADYIENTWPTDPAADLARHQLGRLLIVEKKFPEAVEVLGRVSRAYPDATRSLYQLAYAAQQAQKVEAKLPASRPSYQAQAIAALKSIPDLPPNANSSTAQVFVEAKLTLGTMLYGAKDFPQAAGIADTLQGVLGGLQGAFDAKLRADLESRVFGLKLLARYGQAEADYTAGRYPKVREALEPVVKQLHDPVQAARLAELKDAGIVPALLSLAVRAHVQDNKIESAREILDSFRKVAPESSLEILKQLVLQLRLQIQELRRKGPDVKDDLDKVAANFTSFLDELGKQQEKNPQPELFLFLAQSYSSLDDHKKAAELLGQISEPKPAGEKKELEAKQMQIYRASQLMLARALRLDKQFVQAEKVLRSTLTSNGKPGWGQQNAEVQKERIFLLQDQEKYAGRDGAILAWNALMKQMQPTMKVEAKAKEQYFECYYYLTYCLYKNALKIPDDKKKHAAIRQAANYIVQLEATQPGMGGDGVKKLFDELLQNEPALKRQYAELKKASN